MSKTTSYVPVQAVPAFSFDIIDMMSQQHHITSVHSTVVFEAKYIKKIVFHIVTSLCLHTYKDTYMHTYIYTYIYMYVTKIIKCLVKKYYLLNYLFFHIDNRGNLGNI